MQIPESAGWIAVVVAALTLIGVVYTARQGRLATKAADFTAVTERLDKDNQRLRVEVEKLEVKFENQEIVVRALGRYARDLSHELRLHGLTVPAPPGPPPDLSKHLV